MAYHVIFIRMNLHWNRSFLNNIRMQFWCTFGSLSDLFFKIENFRVNSNLTSIVGMLSTSSRSCCKVKGPTSNNYFIGVFQNWRKLLKREKKRPICQKWLIWHVGSINWQMTAVEHEREGRRKPILFKNEVHIFSPFHNPSMSRKEADGVK